MPEFFTNYSAAIPKQTSIADLVGNMSALQKYNQEQQLMPIQLEGAKAELEKAQQGAAEGGIKLSQTRQANQENLAVQEAIRKNPQSFMTNGRFDPNKLMQQLPTLAPMTHTDYIKKYTDAMTSAANAESAVSKLSEDRRGIIGSTISALGHAGVDNPKIVIRALDQLKKHHKGDEAFSESVDAFADEAFSESVDAFADMFKNAMPGSHISQTAILTGNMLLSPSEQQQLFAPKPGTVNLGDVVQPTVTRPSVVGENPSIARTGTPMDLGVPPTQQVVNSATGETQLVGPASQRGRQTYQTGMGPAQTELLGAGGTNVSKDWTNTTFEAQGAPGRIAVFQNIKKLVPESFTGVGGERKQFLSGLAQAVGIPANVLETSSTDELAKNTKLLQLAGGNTDAARGIAELANPNTKMTKEGILRVTDQLIGMEKMKEAKARYLQPYSQNAQQYQQEMGKFSQISDPRLFQEMSQSEAKKLWDSMSDAEKASMIRMQRQAKQMGVIK